MSDKTPEQIDLSFRRQEMRVLKILHAQQVRLHLITSGIHNLESMERATELLKEFALELNAL